MQPIALHGHMKPVTMVKYSHEGDFLITAAKEPTIHMYRTSDGERIGTFTNHKTVSSVDVNRAGTLMLSTGFDFYSHLWNLETGDHLGEIEHLAPARCGGFSHDDSMLMTVTDNKAGQLGMVALFNLPTHLINGGTVSTQFRPFSKFEQPKAVTFAEWGPTNSSIYFGSDDGSVSILDVETMTEVLRKPLHTEEVRKLHFDANYFTLVTASKDTTAKLLDSRNLEVIQTYENDLPVNDASISPTSDHIIIGGGTEAQEVTTTGGSSKFEVKFYHKVYGSKPLGSIKCHFGTINSVAFHPKGTGFCSGAVDGFVKLFRFDTVYKSSPGYTPCWTEATE